MARYYMKKYNEDNHYVRILDTVDLTEELIERSDYELFISQGNNESKFLNSRDDSFFIGQTIELRNGYIKQETKKLEVVYGSNKMEVFTLPKDYQGVVLNEEVCGILNDTKVIRHITRESRAYAIGNIEVRGTELYFYFYYPNNNRLSRLPCILCIDLISSSISFKNVEVIPMNDMFVTGNYFSWTVPTDFVDGKFFGYYATGELIEFILNKFWLMDTYILSDKIQIDCLNWLLEIYNLKKYKSLIGKKLFLGR